jgi:CcmD family protein
MFSLITAYLLVWTGLLLYVVRLGAQQRRLAQSVDALRRQLQRPEAAAPAPHHSVFSRKGALT